MSDSLQLRGLSPVRHLCAWDCTNKNPGVSCHFLLRGMFSTQEMNLCLLHWRQTLYWWATGKSLLGTIEDWKFMDYVDIKLSLMFSHRQIRLPKHNEGFPGGSDRCRFNSWVRKIPWRRKWLPNPGFLPGEFHGWNSPWWATACSIAVSWTRLKERIMKWLLAQVCGTIVNQNIFHYAPLDQLSFNVLFLALLCCICSIHFPPCIWRIGDSKNPTFVSTLKIYQITSEVQEEIQSRTPK